jgi:hypothetical protein
MATTLTDELTKLGNLRAQGQLSEEEFVAAKRKLLSSFSESETASPPPAVPADLPLPESKTYRSSRWSGGNLLFPDSLELSSDGILFEKGKMFGSSKEFINYRAVASMRIKNRPFLADVTIETSGGSQPIFINGLWKSDAREVQDAIRAHQARA